MLSMADDFYGYDDAENEPKGHDNLFLWTIFILLLIGAAFACWMGSFYIFGHPEQPKPYEILKKLKKIDAPLRFEVTAAPPGEFLTAQKLFERYSKFTRLEPRSLDRMRANSERLHQRKLIERKPGRRMQFVGGDDKPLAHPAIGHHAQHLQIRAAVARPFSAGVAMAAVHVRLDRAAVARFCISHCVASFNNLHAELVAENARILDEGHLAEVATHVRATDTD